MKQTAVEWLFEEYKIVGMLTTAMVKKAKAMEKEQIVSAYSHGWYDDLGGDAAAVVYYTQTFKSE